MTILQNLTWLDLLGCLGAVSYLAGFAAQQLHVIPPSGPAYALSKLIGSALMLLSLSESFNLGAWFLQLSWFTISAVTLYLIWKRSKAKRSTVSQLRTPEKPGADNLNIAC